MYNIKTNKILEQEVIKKHILNNYNNMYIKKKGVLDTALDASNNAPWKRIHFNLKLTTICFLNCIYPCFYSNVVSVYKFVAALTIYVGVNIG